MTIEKNMISVTELAAKKINANLIRRGKGLGIKIGVKTTGCSGLSYVLEYIDDDQKRCIEHHESNGVRIYMDPKHRPYLYGLTIDWAKEGLNEGFKFINPNEKDRCGCGESFRV